ncbi:MAG: Uma2 family endonuclease [Vulcanimicrobiaceae bacterium]
MASVGPAVEHIVVSQDVPWEAYASLVRELGDHNRLRLAYSGGTLEIMSPSLEREALSRLVDALVTELSIAWGVDVEAYGSMTMQLPSLAKGAEADSCYYVLRASTMRGRRAIDLARDPAPDVVLEVDLTSSRTAKNDIYAALRVPEVWRHNGETLQAYLLTPESAYVASDRSVVFSGLSFREMDRHIDMAKTVGRREAIIAWRRWLEANVPPATA